jgi:hypothetical protein
MLDLALFARREHVNCGGGNLQMLSQRFIDNANIAAGDRAECEFLLAGYADFSHKQDIQIAMKILRDFEGDGNAAAGERKDKGSRQAAFFPELRRKEPAGLNPITEDGRCERSRRFLCHGYGPHRGGNNPRTIVERRTARTTAERRTGAKRVN